MFDLKTIQIHRDSDHAQKPYRFITQSELASVGVLAEFVRGPGRVRKRFRWPAGAGCRVLGAGCWVPGAGCRVSGPSLKNRLRKKAFSAE